MLTNEKRREILETARAVGYKGSVLDLYNAARAGQDISQLLQPQNMEVAQTPEQQSQGLRPQHAAGNTNASMAFPNVPPNTPFNTKGMKAPINISKFDEQGHLVQSFKNVPPGIESLPTGPGKGTVIETPAYKKGGYRAKHQLGSFKDRLFPPKVQQMHNNLEPAHYGGMLDEATVTPYTSSEYALQERMGNKATGGIEPVYPVFDALTGLGVTRAGAKQLASGIASKANTALSKATTPSLYRNIDNAVSGFQFTDDMARQAAKQPLALPEPATFYRGTTPDKFADIMNPVSTAGDKFSKAENLRFFSPDKSMARRYMQEAGDQGIGVSTRLNIQNPFNQGTSAKVLDNQYIQGLMDQGYDAVYTQGAKGPGLRNAYEVIPLDKNVIQNAQQLNNFESGGYKAKYQFGGREGDAFQEVDTYIKPGQSTRPNWAQTPDAVTNYTFGKNLVDDESRFSLGLQGTDILDEIKYRADLIGSGGIGIGNRKGKSFRPAGENLRAGIRGQASWQGVPGNVLENMFPRSGVNVRGSFEGEAGLGYANGAISPYMSVTPQTNFSLNDNLSLGVGYEMRGRYDKNRNNPIYGSTGTGTVAPLSQRDAYSGMGRGAGRLSLKYDMGDGDFIEGYYSKPNSLYQGSMYPVPGVIALENEGPRFGVRLKKSF